MQRGAPQVEQVLAAPNLLGPLTAPMGAPLACGAACVMLASDRFVQRHKLQACHAEATSTVPFAYRVSSIHPRRPAEDAAVRPFLFGLQRTAVEIAGQALTSDRPQTFTAADPYMKVWRGGGWCLRACASSPGAPWKCV